MIVIKKKIEKKRYNAIYQIFKNKLTRKSLFDNMLSGGESFELQSKRNVLLRTYGMYDGYIFAN